MIFVALQQHLMVNTDEEKTMSEMMTRLLERLAEMFPDSVYQSTLWMHTLPADVHVTYLMLNDFNESSVKNSKDFYDC